MKKVRPVGMLSPTVEQVVVATALAMTALACGEVDQAPPAAPVRRAPTPSAPLDVSAVIQQVRLAFRADAEGFVGGVGSYSVRVERAALTVTPWHFPTEPAGWTEPLEGPSVRFETLAIERDGRLVGGSAGRPTIDEPGTLSLPRGAVTEQLTNRDEGVEQRWVFAERPTGSGPLVVRVGAEGAPWRGETAGGHHFREDESPGLRFGHAAWIDATGARTEVRVRWTGGVLEASVPPEVVDGSAYPAVLDPIISAEMGTDRPAFGSPPQSQTYAAVSRGATSWLVAWTDFRTAANELYAARVSSAGVVLDPTGIRIASASANQNPPGLSWDGVNWLVVYERGTDLFATRVSADGALLDATEIPVASAPSLQTAPAVSYDGTNWLVVWQDNRISASVDYDIFGARVSRAGTVLDPTGVTISAAANSQAYPSVSHDGTNWLVAWRDARNSATTGNDIYGARVSATGSVLDAAGIAISTAAGGQARPHLGYDGTNWLVAWEDGRNTATTGDDVYGARVSSAGAVLDATGIALCAAADTQGRPYVGYDGTNWLVVWQDNRNAATTAFDLYGARVTSAGDLLDVSGLPLVTAPGNQARPALEHDGTHWLLVWDDARRGATNLDVYGARLTNTGSVLETDGFLISTWRNTQREPALAHDGTNWLLVWRDYRNNQSDIYGVRVSPAGTVLDPTGIAVCTADGEQLEPTVAHNGTDWLVAWRDYRNSSVPDVYGARVSSGGVVLDSTGIAVSTAVSSQLEPAVSSDGVGWLVVWQDERTAGNLGDIYGARVSAAGAVLDTAGIAIRTGTARTVSPAVSHDGSNWLVVWNEAGSGADLDVYGARVSSAATVLDSAGVAISATAAAELRPTIAWGGASWLVVWDDSRNAATTGEDIYGARVSGAGVVLDSAAIAISTASNDQQSPAIAHDGTDWLVVWHDLRNGGTGDIYAGRVSPAGTVVDPAGLEISAVPTADEVSPQLAGDGQRALVAYQVTTTLPDERTTRVRARVVTHDADGGTTSDAGALSDGGAGTPDGGANTPDGGAGTPDGGAGTPDGGADGGLPADASTLTDGGADAGLLPTDAGLSDASDGGTGPTTPGGCACTFGGGRIGAMWMPAVMLLALSRRRRRSSARSTWPSATTTAARLLRSS